MINKFKFCIPIFWNNSLNPKPSDKDKYDFLRICFINFSILLYLYSHTFILDNLKDLRIVSLAFIFSISLFFFIKFKKIDQKLYGLKTIYILLSFLIFLFVINIFVTSYINLIVIYIYTIINLYYLVFFDFFIKIFTNKIEVEKVSMGIYIFNIFQIKNYKYITFSYLYIGVLILCLIFALIFLSINLQ